MYSSKAVRKKYPQKRRILRGWRRGGRIAIKAHEIASQNSFSIRFSQNFAYARVLSGVQIMISHANLGAAIPTRVPMRNLGAVSPRPAASPPADLRFGYQTHGSIHLHGTTPHLFPALFRRKSRRTERGAMGQTAVQGSTYCSRARDSPLCRLDLRTLAQRKL